VNYYAYGLVLSSDLPLPELEPAGAAGNRALSITLRSEPVSEDGWTWPQPRPAVADGRWRAVGVRGRQHRLLFDGGADFVVSPHDAEIRVHNTSGAPTMDVLHHRLIDQVVPLVMSHLGRLVLHGSAFVTPRGAVAVLGAPGAGKSTLAASFGLNGAPVIADDALFLERDGERILAVPAYGGIRVCHDALSALRGGTARRSRKSTSPAKSGGPGRNAGRKQRLTSRDGVAFAPAPVALGRVYVLQPANQEAAAIDRVEIRRLSPRDAIMALVGHAFTLDIGDRQRLMEQFLRVCAACASLDVRSLAAPRDFSLLPSTRDAILADLSSP
jgi:hypothetical protein